MPDTPVTQVNVPSGMVTSMFFRLFSARSLDGENLPFPFRRVFGDRDLSFFRLDTGP